MEYTRLLKKYDLSLSQENVEVRVMDALRKVEGNKNDGVYKQCYACIDLTSLNETDNIAKIEKFANKVINFNSQFPDIPNVASICVYPNFVDTVGLAVGDSGLKITAVAGGFPSSQTFLEVKMLEVAMAVETGADEIDVVMNVGQMIAGEYEPMANEIEILKNELGDEAILKVIIESGALDGFDMIRKASLLAMMAGADFIKTSTGKTPVAATPQAAVVMCQAIKDYFEETGRKVGFKAAGGIKTVEDAVLYYTIVEDILGEEWLSPALFRIGASSVANNILSAITGEDVVYY